MLALFLKLVKHKSLHLCVSVRELFFKCSEITLIGLSLEGGCNRLLVCFLQKEFFEVILIHLGVKYRLDLLP